MKKLLFIIVVLVLSGCRTGILYTNIVRPYSHDFYQTPTGTKKCVIDSHRVEEPFTGFNLSAEWDETQIQHIAHQEGIKTIHYIDLKTFSVLFGIYRRQSFVVYGD